MAGDPRPERCDRPESERTGCGYQERMDAGTCDAGGYATTLPRDARSGAIVDAKKGAMVLRKGTKREAAGKGVTGGRVPGGLVELEGGGGKMDGEREGEAKPLGRVFLENRTVRR